MRRERGGHRRVEGGLVELQVAGLGGPGGVRGQLPEHPHRQLHAHPVARGVVVAEGRRLLGDHPQPPVPEPGEHLVPGRHQVRDPAGDLHRGRVPLGGRGPRRGGQRQPVQVRLGGEQLQGDHLVPPQPGGHLPVHEQREVHRVAQVGDVQEAGPLGVQDPPGGLGAPPAHRQQRQREARGVPVDPQRVGVQRLPGGVPGVEGHHAQAEPGRVVGGGLGGEAQVRAQPRQRAAAVGVAAAGEQRGGEAQREQAGAEGRGGHPAR